ncbi:response regulator transcription factor [Actinocorallia aurea]
MNAPIRVLVADDQALLRGSFRALIETAPDLAVVGEAATGAEAVELTRALAPDVVLMDVRMPHVDGVEATRRILRDPGTADVRVTRRLIEEFAARPAEPGRPLRRTLHGVTEREVEVLTLIARGLSNTEMAAHLHLSLATVKTYVGRLLTKLDARDRAQLVIIAYESGLVGSR